MTSPSFSPDPPRADRNTPRFPHPMPEVRRGTRKNSIDWSPALVDWLYACRRDGVTVADLARGVGCSTQTVFTVFNRDPRGVPAVDLRVVCTQQETPRRRRGITPEAFAAWGKGKAQDMVFRPMRRVAAVVGPFTRIEPRRTIGRPLSLED